MACCYARIILYLLLIMIVSKICQIEGRLPLLPSLGMVFKFSLTMSGFAHESSLAELQCGRYAGCAKNLCVRDSARQTFRMKPQDKLNEKFGYYHIFKNVIAGIILILNPVRNPSSKDHGDCNIRKRILLFRPAAKRMMLRVFQEDSTSYAGCPMTSLQPPIQYDGLLS